MDPQVTDHGSLRTADTLRMDCGTDSEWWTVLVFLAFVPNGKCKKGCRLRSVNRSFI